MDKVTVKFLPDKKEIRVSPGVTLLSAALDCGIFLNSHCAGNGTCGGCKVNIKNGHVKSPSGHDFIEHGKKLKTVLACQAIVDSDVEVVILSESRMHKLDKAIIPKNNKQSFNVENLLLKRENDFQFDQLPLVEKLYIELSKPDINNNTADTDRLLSELKRIKNVDFIDIDISEVKIISSLLRSCQWKVTVSLYKKDNYLKVINLEPFDKRNENYGIVFDIGTTTVNASLVDFNAYQVITTKSNYNKQVLLGEDIITRIVFCEKNAGLKQMNLYLLETMNELINSLLGELKLKLTSISCLLCVGNPTMMHLFFKVDPVYIRKQPYTSVANVFPVVKANQTDLGVSPFTIVCSLPGVSSYVGSDTTSGIFYSQLYKQENPCLFIDIGTNGEIALGNKDWLVCAAASAGPAFEGSGLSNGMRAAEGAVEDVIIDDDLNVKIKTIGNSSAVGICGTGYISLINQMLKKGIIDRSGSFKNTEKIVKRNENKYFVVVKANKTKNKKDIIITSCDIDNIKRSKAAIYSACCVLLKEMQLKFDQIDKVFIAGGFGTALDIDSAVNIGLLPNLENKQFIFLGNAALKGANMASFSETARKEIDSIALKLTYFDLSSNSLYMQEYMSALFFPHTELSRFSSRG